MVGFPEASGFRLTPYMEGRGVSCDARGCFIGDVPLLTRRRDSGGQDYWAPRSAEELNALLDSRYGHPIDISTKMGGLSDIADALNRGDVFGAQVGTLRLKLPDPPPTSGNGPAARLTALLHASGMLRQLPNVAPPADNDPERLAPRPPAANDNVRPGRFAADPRIIPAQELILGEPPLMMSRPMIQPWEIPWEAPWPGPKAPQLPEGLTAPRPWQGPAPDVPLDIPGSRPRQGPMPQDIPWEIPRSPTPDVPESMPWALPKPGTLPPDAVLPAPREIPGYQLRKRRSPQFPLENPYPDDPGCEKEWQEAYKRCAIYMATGKFKRGYSGPGKDYFKCMQGQISERCGGNAYDGKSKPTA